MFILLTGGSGCGKSTYAEKLAVRFPGPRYYLATMRPYDQECAQRIERHRRMRAGKGFETIERYTALHELALPERGAVLLECICNLIANEMFAEDGTIQPDAEQRVLTGVDSLARQSENMIVVTNDVGSGDGSYGPGVLAYVALMGRVNRLLAERADRVVELVCGIPLPRKGGLL